ncbi:DUF1127 domain-containing protein [uncultured Tateyamaria sp.]|uniref:DUF1127 domain-containing protein n=1 Tax=uncultured Tateyamaria sp. TaxID=455651 RepID=UPI0026320F33|nr:DUF1127 domain-containing protein [uncultured Tateyamaria sp.]
MTRSLQSTHPHLAYLTAQTNMPAVSVLAVRVAVTVSKWATRRRTRLALRQLTAEQLRDVGLTPVDASIETRRVFWRA